MAGDIEIVVQGDETANKPLQGDNSSFDLEVTGNSVIQTQSSSSGDTGNINVTVGKEVDNGGEQIFEGGDASFTTGGSILSSIFGSGRGGNIQFTAGNLELDGLGSSIQAQNINSELTRETLLSRLLATCL